MWWMNLLWILLHLLHFLDYFHFLEFFQFLYLFLHYPLYRIYVLHLHIVIPLEKYLQLGHIQQARKLIFMGENGLRAIMVLKNINGSHPFYQYFLRPNIGSKLTPRCEEGETLYCLY